MTTPADATGTDGATVTPLQGGKRQAQREQAALKAAAEPAPATKAPAKKAPTAATGKVRWSPVTEGGGWGRHRTAKAEHGDYELAADDDGRWTIRYTATGGKPVQLAEKVAQSKAYATVVSHSKEQGTR